MACHFPADDYHPYYPPRDDYQERLLANAPRMACASLLMCRTYTPEEIKAEIEEHALRTATVRRPST